MKKKRVSAAKREAVLIRRELNKIAAAKYRAACLFRAAATPGKKVKGENKGTTDARKKLKGLSNAQIKSVEIRAQKEIQNLNAISDIYREAAEKPGREKKQKEVDKLIKGVSRGDATIIVEYRYYQRRECLDFVLHHKIPFYVMPQDKRKKYNPGLEVDFIRGVTIKRFKEPKIKIKTYLNFDVKTQAAEITSEIDKAFEGMQSDKYFQLFVKGTAVIDTDVVNG